MSLQSAAIPRQIAYEPELKYFDTVKASAVNGFYITPQLFDLTQIPTAGLPTVRDGLVVRPIRLEMRARIARNSSDDICRFTIVQFRTDVAALSASDIYAIAITSKNLAPFERQLFGDGLHQDSRAIVLYDHHYPVSSVPIQHHVDLSFDFTPTKENLIRFLQSGATNTPVTGGLALVTTGTYNGASGPVLEFVARLLYVDS
jgi:hypothetical protein